MLSPLSKLFRRSDGQQPKWIETADLQRRLVAGGPVLVIDVRQPEEFASPPGHLPGALNIPLADVARRAGEIASRRQPVIVVCKTDRRSARAAAELIAAGLPDVAVLRGGTDAWYQEGFALE